MDDLDAEAAERVGTTFAGRWVIERVLGTGGMAAVFLGRAADGSKVALKILHPEVNRELELRKRFVREGSIGNLLGAPERPGDPVTEGFVRVLESGESDEGEAFLAMEVLEGESLYDKITRERTMPPAEVLSLAEQVLDVLVVAHARGIVHRDLKPENLHVTADGKIKVLDFGIARVLDAVAAARGEGMPEKTATKTGVIMGTAAYMAPEQATGLVKEIDARTDVFALGATLFRLLAGRTVHGPLESTQEIIAAATEPPMPLARAAGGLSPDICAVVDRALAFLKLHRYPDAATMRDDIRALRAGRRPPYAAAVGDGQIAPGGPSSRAFEQPAGQPSARVPVAATVVERVATTQPDRQGPAPTQIDRPDRPAATQPDPPKSLVPTLVVIIGGVALVAGIAVGVVLTTCGSSSEDQAPAQDAAPSRDGGPRPRIRLPIKPKSD